MQVFIMLHNSSARQDTLTIKLDCRQNNTEAARSLGPATKYVAPPVIPFQRRLSSSPVTKRPLFHYIFSSSTPTGSDVAFCRGSRARTKRQDYRPGLNPT